MLSRTANNLFWIARYMERMDYVARLLEVAQRTAALAPGGLHAGNEWHSAIIAAGCEAGFFAKYDTVSPAAAMDFLIRDRDNPSSIFSTIETARSNARAVRGGLTRDAWEAINGTWLEAPQYLQAAKGPESLGRVLDWVVERSLLFLGAYGSTMMRNDAYYFVRLGTFIERADNTARILDVKYHILLPEFSGVGGGIDYHQWSAILRAVSALRAYHWLYSDRVQPWKVAELLIFRPEMPRSLRSSYDQITEALNALAGAYHGRTGECHRLAGATHARLTYGKVDQVFQIGLHEFLTEIIDSTILLGKEIGKFYLF
jgi:uncharacterized alpha-E superfamily protein